MPGSKCPKCKGSLVRHGEHNWCAACKKMFCGLETEVFSRVVGYFRPVKNWNKGKQAEFKERRLYQPIIDGQLTPLRPRKELAPTGGRWVASA